MNELRKSNDSSLTLGLLPKISIDPRIRCRRTFSAEFPPPPPPTQRYVEIACRAASKITTTTWSFRQYIEVIRVGYTLDQLSPKHVYMSGEVILVTPTINEKISVRCKELIVGQDWHRREIERVEGNELVGPDEEYDVILTRLAENLLAESQKAVQQRKLELNSSFDQLLKFQIAFESSKET